MDKVELQTIPSIKKFTKLFTIAIFSFIFFSCENTNEDVFNSAFNKGELGTTSISSISSIRDTTATVNCLITYKGKGYLLARGVCWGISQTPTIDSSHITVTDTGKVALKLQKLKPGVLYYVRPYLTNKTGTSYGDVLSFTTKNKPTIITLDPANLTSTTVTIGGNVTADGGDSVTVRGICWNTSSNPDIALTTKTANGAGKGTFSTNITNLTIGTTYYARAYATNSFGTVYGNEITFTTQNLPTISTTDVTNITTVTATSGGNISSDGGSIVITRGICWGTSQNPTIDLTTKTNEGIGIGSFSSTMVSLQLGTTYYVRAYATNSIGTVYGQNIQFTTNTYAMVSTNSVSGITATTATCGGNVSTDGGASVTARGVCWSTNTNPTISLSTKTTDGNGTGNFSSSITGLASGTSYYVRAYATNAAGTVYGANVTFTTNGLATITTTALSNITATTASSGGNITADGGAAVTARGVCWSTTSFNPTADLTTKTVDGSGTGTFSSAITGLSYATTYYVRAYATNNVGTVYGTMISFTTPGFPTVNTTTPSAITAYTAGSGGNVTSDGGATVTARGVCWSTSTNPTASLTTKTIDNSGTGIFSSNITGLSPNTTYYVRAYATNSVGTSYGNQLSFTTAPPPTAPILTTTAASAITSSTATGGGNITSDGGATVTARGVCWSTGSAPTIASSKTTDGTGAGSFASSISGLLPLTKYYVRAYATNIVGTSYGNELSFTTLADLPTLTTTALSLIRNSTATSGGNITSDGGAAVTSKGVCWSTTTNPTISDNITTDGIGTGVFISSMKGLTENTTYYVRAYATNSAGTAYGNEITFKTLPATGTVKDLDGNTYHYVTIGTQTWMVENLKVTRLNDGTSIPNVTDQTAWNALTTPGYCSYNNNDTYISDYGLLYNWYALNTGKLAPTGWHVASDTDWKTLGNYLGKDAGVMLREAGTTHWFSVYYYTPIDQFGFTALPAGERDNNGSTGITYCTYWWSSTVSGNDASSYTIQYNNVYLTPVISNRSYGMSVRCVRD